MTEEAVSQASPFIGADEWERILAVAKKMGAEPAHIADWFGISPERLDKFLEERKLIGENESVESAIRRHFGSEVCEEVRSMLDCYGPTWYIQLRALQQDEMLNALHALRDELHGMNEDIARRHEEAAGRIGDGEPRKDAGTTSCASTEAPGAGCGEVRA